MYEYKGRIVSVYDADTVTIILDLGFNVSIKEKIRLYGINCPELRTKNEKEKALAIEARDFVRELILGEEVEITVYKKGKYGRYLAGIFLESGELLNELLIKKGYAREYFGVGKAKWEEE